MPYRQTCTKGSNIVLTGKGCCLLCFVILCAEEEPQGGDPGLQGEEC